MKINFISSRNFIESRDMYNSILRRYQGGIHESMRGSEFVFDYVKSSNYISHKVDLKR